MTFVLPENNPNFKRTVYIIDRYDNRYISFYLNGKQVDTTHKEGFETVALKRKNRAEWAKLAGVESEDELLFTFYGFYDQFDHTDDDFDGNDYYDNWQAVVDKLISNPFKPRFDAIDLAELEDYDA